MVNLQRAVTAARLLPVDMSVTQTHDHVDHMTHSSTERTRMDRDENKKYKKIKRNHINASIMHTELHAVQKIQAIYIDIYI